MIVNNQLLYPQPCQLPTSQAPQRSCQPSSPLKKCKFSESHHLCDIEDVYHHPILLLNVMKLIHNCCRYHDSHCHIVTVS